MDILDENLVIMSWFYVKNCIFVHIIDHNFPVTGPTSETPAPYSLQSGSARTAPATVQYVMYFRRFVDDVRSPTNNGQVFGRRELGVYSVTRQAVHREGGAKYGTYDCLAIALL